MPFTRHGTPTPVEMLPGIIRRTLTAGDKMMLIEVTLDTGVLVVPMHTHPHEQTGYVVSGRMRLQIADQTLDLDPGDAYMIPGGAEHEATALEPLVIVDDFPPARRIPLTQRVPAGFKPARGDRLGSGSYLLHCVIV